MHRGPLIGGLGGGDAAAQADDPANKLRLVLLYALRYEREPSNRIAKFTETLGQVGASAEQRAVSLLLDHYSTAQSTRTSSAISDAYRDEKSLQRSVKGVQNVYTQHQPHHQQLAQLLKGTLSDVTYPYLSDPGPANKKRAPTEVVVAILGGVTYEEAKCVGEMNAANPGVKIVLCGTTVHNCDSFLEESPSSRAPPRVHPLPRRAPPASPPRLLAPPNVDRKRIAALTSSVTSTVQSGVNQAMSKLQ